MVKFEARWVVSVPDDECGDADIDKAVWAEREFANHDAAVTFAASVAGGSFFGVASVQKWESMSAAEFVASEDDWTDYYPDKKHGVVWVASGEAEEVEPA